MHDRRALGAMPVAIAILLALSIAPPAMAQSPAPGGPADPMAPAWVTGYIQYAPTCDIPSMTMAEGVGQYRGTSCGPQTWVTSDPRLSGSAVASWNSDVYFLPSGPVSLAASRYEVANDGGTWSCRDGNTLGLGAGTAPTPVNPEALTCEGAGAYEGLMAVLVLPESDRSITGLIFPGELPPIP